jgi:hypothetical protein
LTRRQPILLPLSLSPSHHRHQHQPFTPVDLVSSPTPFIKAKSTNHQSQVAGWSKFDSIDLPLHLANEKAGGRVVLFCYDFRPLITILLRLICINTSSCRRRDGDEQHNKPTAHYQSPNDNNNHNRQFSLGA